VSELVTWLGMLLVFAGMGVEALSIIAMSSYELRRRLPLDSPIPLLSYGCMIFATGTVLTLVRLWL
jgi:hypothetical protein